MAKLELTLRNIIKDINFNDDELNYQCRCDNCGKENFTEYRFKCLICKDYDLCGRCFEERKLNKEHEICHPMHRFDVPCEVFGLRFPNSEINLNNFRLIFNSQLHKDVTCDICKIQIKGVRFKCDTCVDYDLCFDCYEQKKSTLSHSASEHPLIFMKEQFLKLDTNEIELVEELAEGGFGKVYKAKLKNSQKLIACKIIKDKANPKLALQELYAYNELKGINLLRMFGYAFKDDTLWIITEYMAKGSLASLLEHEKDLSLRRRLDIVCGIVSGMARIHDHAFIHYDIRPDNILISENYLAKIGDMGIATNSSEPIAGCIHYMPPEFYMNECTQKLDIFMFGLTLNEIYNGVHAEKNYMIKIIKESHIFSDIINQCVSNKPDERPDSNSLKRRLIIIQRLMTFLITEKYSDYIDKNQFEKNEIFINCYNLILKTIRYF